MGNFVIMAEIKGILQEKKYSGGMRIRCGRVSGDIKVYMR